MYRGARPPPYLRGCRQRAEAPAERCHAVCGGRGPDGSRRFENDDEATTGSGRGGPHHHPGPGGPPSRGRHRRHRHRPGHDGARSPPDHRPTATAGHHTRRLRPGGAAPVVRGAGRERISPRARRVRPHLHHRRPGVRRPVPPTAERRLRLRLRTHGDHGGTGRLRGRRRDLVGRARGGGAHPRRGVGDQLRRPRHPRRRHPHQHLRQRPVVPGAERLVRLGRGQPVREPRPRPGHARGGRRHQLRLRLLRRRRRPGACRPDLARHAGGPRAGPRPGPHHLGLQERVVRLDHHPGVPARLRPRAPRRLPPASDVAHVDPADERPHQPRDVGRPGRHRRRRRSLPRAVRTVDLRAGDLHQPPRRVDLPRRADDPVHRERRVAPQRAGPHPGDVRRLRLGPRSALSRRGVRHRRVPRLPPIVPHPIGDGHRRRRARFRPDLATQLRDPVRRLRRLRGPVGRQLLPVDPRAGGGPDRPPDLARRHPQRHDPGRGRGPDLCIGGVLPPVRRHEPGVDHRPVPGDPRARAGRRRPAGLDGAGRRRDAPLHHRAALLPVLRVPTDSGHEPLPAAAQAPAGRQRAGHLDQRAHQRARRRPGHRPGVERRVPPARSTPGTGAEPPESGRVPSGVRHHAPWPRGVAQSGSAPALGAGGRRFESCLPDRWSGPRRAAPGRPGGGRRHEADEAVGMRC